jgi:hypothetical protein
MVNPPPGASWEDLPLDGAEPHVPSYDTAAAVDDALSAVKARFDHGDAPYDPDILALIRAAEAMREKLYGPAGDDPMPVFVIKGKDALASHAVSAYALLCNSHGQIMQAREVDRAVLEIQDWQFRNRDHVKMPNHEHVPVTGS